MFVFFTSGVKGTKDPRMKNWCVQQKSHSNASSSNIISYNQTQKWKERNKILTSRKIGENVLCTVFLSETILLFNIEDALHLFSKTYYEDIDVLDFDISFFSSIIYFLFNLKCSMKFVSSSKWSSHLVLSFVIKKPTFFSFYCNNWT